MVAPKNYSWSFRNVYLRNRDLTVFVLSDDDSMKTDVPVSSLAIWNGTDWISQVSRVANGTAFAMTDKPRAPMMLGKEGCVYIWDNDGSFDEEAIDQTDYGPQNYGDLEDIRIIAGKAYAVGMARSVYVRTGMGKWKAIDKGIRSEGDEDVGFMSIDGFGGKKIYAVGFEGEIATFDGRSWEFFNSLTNLILYRVLCVPNGKVFVCGQSGILIEGHKNTWRIIEQTETEETIWSMAWFKNQLFLSTSEGIYKLEDDDLRIVEIKPKKGKKIIVNKGVGFYRLAANKSVLWSVGSKMAIWTNDGTFWEEVSYK